MTSHPQINNFITNYYCTIVCINCFFHAILKHEKINFFILFPFSLMREKEREKKRERERERKKEKEIIKNEMIIRFYSSQIYTMYNIKIAFFFHKI